MPSDPNGILQAVYDATNNQLNTEAVVGTPALNTSGHDLASILAAVYDSATNTLRVITVA